MRQKLKAREWDEMMAKNKLKVLEAVVRGCMWEGEDSPLDMLQPYAVCMIEPLNSEETNSPEENATRQQRNDRCEFMECVYLSCSCNQSHVLLLYPECLCV